MQITADVAYENITLKWLERDRCYCSETLTPVRLFMVKAEFTKTYLFCKYHSGVSLDLPLATCSVDTVWTLLQLHTYSAAFQLYYQHKMWKKTNKNITSELPADFSLKLVLPSSLQPEVQCATFCSPAVRTACAGSGQRRSCRGTAFCPVSITTTLLGNTAMQTDVPVLREKTPATGRRKGELDRMWVNHMMLM